MKIFRERAKLRKWCEARRMAGARIALVPTMGFLHAGHLSLIAEAKRRKADEVVVSIFVNPVQFGPGEDYAVYPRDEKADIAKCRAAGATAVFIPSPEEMYEKDRSVWVEEVKLSQGLCGARRPGHFRGVCTVVAKLFNIVRPHFAVFGQKDFQQQAVIKRMVRDLDFGIEIVTAPIVREASGLALSSRNTYLDGDSHDSALALSATLEFLSRLVKDSGKVNWSAARKKAQKILDAAGLKTDYIEAVDAETLEPVKVLKSGVAVLLAAYAGRTRLIDNAVM